MQVTQAHGRLTRRVDACALSLPTKTTLGRKGSRFCAGSALVLCPRMMLLASSSAGWQSVVKMWVIFLTCRNKSRSNPPWSLRAFPMRGGKKCLAQKIFKALAVAATMSSALPPFIRMQPRTPLQRSKVLSADRNRMSSLPFLSSRMKQAVVALAIFSRQTSSKDSDKHHCMKDVRSLAEPPSLIECPFCMLKSMDPNSWTEGAVSKSSSLTCPCRKATASLCFLDCWCLWSCQVFRRGATVKFSKSALSETLSALLPFLAKERHGVASGLRPRLVDKAPVDLRCWNIAQAEQPRPKETPSKWGPALLPKRSHGNFNLHWRPLFAQRHLLHFFASHRLAWSTARRWPHSRTGGRLETTPFPMV